MLVQKVLLTPLQLKSGGLVWLCLAPLFYSALSVSAKLAGSHLSVWQISVGRFGLGLLVIPFICSAFIGTSLVLWPFEASVAFNLGHLFAVCSSFLCALTLLLVRRLGRENNIYTLFFYLCLTGTPAGLGPLLVQELPILPVNTAGWLGVAAVAVFSIGAQLSINQALVRIPAPKVGVIMTIEVPLVACFGVLYLGEPLNWNFIAGTLLILGSGTGLNLMPVRSR